METEFVSVAMLLTKFGTWRWSSAKMECASQGEKEYSTSLCPSNWSKEIYCYLFQINHHNARCRTSCSHT